MNANIPTNYHDSGRFAIAERPAGHYAIDATHMTGETPRAEAFDAIARELTSRLGQPKSSGMSEALYWYTANNRSIRLATHRPFYFFEDSGVNLNLSPALSITGGIAGTDLSAGGTDVLPERFDPQRVAKAAIAANEALAPADIDAMRRKVAERDRNIAYWSRCHAWCNRFDARRLSDNRKLTWARLLAFGAKYGIRRQPRDASKYTYLSEVLRAAYASRVEPKPWSVR